LPGYVDSRTLLWFTVCTRLVLLIPIELAEKTKEGIIPMIKRMSRRFFLQSGLALALLLLVTALWVTKTTASSTAALREYPADNIARKELVSPRPHHLFVPARRAFQQPATTEKTIEQAEKNIKVLTGMPQSQLIPMMNLMAASLGVRCNYCHVNNAGKWDFAADDKNEKKTAREMITMTLNINKVTFKGRTEVGCYTCHKGRTSPMGVPVLPLPAPPQRPQGAGPGGPGAAAPGAAATASPQPTADDILNKYVAAVGGQAAIDKLKSRVMIGTYSAANGMSAAVIVEQGAPDKFHVTLNLQQGKMERGFDGAAGWEKGPGGITDLDSDRLADMKSAFSLFSDLKLKEQFSRMTVRKDKLDGRDVYMIIGTRVDSKRERLYFDAETGLLLRRSTAVQTPLGVIPQETNFEDYRDVDGVKVPFTISVLAIDQGASAVRKYTEIKNNAPVDNSLFNKPAATPANNP
jgi:Photosynthetic reaction centre cytochrome C subunit